jgi:hypothetical protein
MNGMIIRRKMARKKARLPTSEMEKLMSQVIRLQHRLTWHPVVKEMHSIVDLKRSLMTEAAHRGWRERRYDGVRM